MVYSGTKNTFFIILIIQILCTVRPNTSNAFSRFSNSGVRDEGVQEVLSIFHGNRLYNMDTTSDKQYVLNCLSKPSLPSHIKHKIWQTKNNYRHLLKYLFKIITNTIKNIWKYIKQGQIVTKSTSKDKFRKQLINHWRINISKVFTQEIFYDSVLEICWALKKGMIKNEKRPEPDPLYKKKVGSGSDLNKKNPLKTQK